MKGKTISSYWNDFTRTINRNKVEKYWDYIDKICVDVKDGKIYNTEPIIRELILRIFHYAQINNSITKKDFSMKSLKKYLNENYYDIYRNGIMRIICLQVINRSVVNETIQQLLSELFDNAEYIRIMNSLPMYFMDEANLEYKSKDDILTYSNGEINIRFDTVHGVKGQTHDATLYLETEYRNSSDIKRILPYFGCGKIPTSSSLYNYSRKIVYVGMSRPKTLLCVAVQESTYKSGKKVFYDWEIIDLRDSKGKETVN